MRLGDLDALGGVVYEKFQKHYGKSDIQPLRDFYKCVVKQIANAPTIDAVEVVRCKHCNFRSDLTGVAPFMYYYCENTKGLSGEVRNNDYCPYGERRKYCGNG